ncbi:thyroid transcription factor 1-associated protein 26 homolog isoform X2 [Stegostoma tigrinum]|uniref:thyroid transcription factor 1-associated protein 26 homolog isoform X2 n=1 Tax=Stegostoma tigrinum TaxID=3053191 RepID=UPI00202AC784|nr:thyroid transcription factor 1-associated protein 26 homolog isoform X2 [Stegostoma tigrinum]
MKNFVLKLGKYSTTVTVKAPHKITETAAPCSPTGWSDRPRLPSQIDDVHIMASSSRKRDGRTFAKKVHPGPGLRGRQRSQQKQRWIANHFKKGWGSVREGQGFAFQQKEKIKHEYKKILRKERKAQHSKEIQFNENYPDHLRHLYLAEEELLKKQSEKAKKNKTASIDQPTLQTEEKKKKKRKSSYQKIKEEFEKRQAEKLKQKELRNVNKKRKRRRENTKKIN